MGLYKEEEERKGEDRRKEDRRREDRGGQDRRREDRRKKERRGEEKRRRKKRIRRTLFWLLIIAFVSLVFSALTGNIPVIFEKLYNYKDESYRPMDADRMKYELEKAKPVGKK